MNIKVKKPKAPKMAPTKRTKSKNNAAASTAARSKQPVFGPVSTITTAPVAIGNSVCGQATRITNIGEGMIRVRGRDFMFPTIGKLATITTWSCVGGSPLSPGAFADTTLANLMRNYSKFRFRRLIAHFITSSPTSASGDICFYYGKDRSSVFLNQTSPQLMGFVLSDPSTVIGPQWTNHSTEIVVTGDWKLCDYGMHDGVEEYADGELFLLSKTTSTDSPGYVLFDYEIEFAGQQLQPRLLTFPIPRIQYHQTNLTKTNAVIVGEPTAGTGRLTLGGVNISGSTATAPSGTKAGDLYKCIFDVTNSNPAAWVNCTPANALNAGIGNFGSVSMGLTDGVTVYALCLDEGTNAWGFYENATQAYAAFGTANSVGICWGVAAVVTFNIQVWLSFIGTINSTAYKPNY